MSTPILATKLYIPPTRAKIVLRPRLIERLNEGLHHNLTLVSAPAGFGKTTLVSEWVSSCKRPVAWLSLDEEDKDPTRFLAYLVAALQTISADLGAGALATMQSPQPPSTESILTALINEITSLTDDFILVLDDYHVIDSQPVDNILAFLIEHLPQQMHLVIATREDPQLPLARLRARGQLTELRSADLRFTLPEAAGFLNEVMGLHLSSDDIAELEARTEGWIAGLQLTALSLQGLQDIAGFIHSFTGSHRFVLDYLIEEVLHKQSEDIQNFLLRTSILDRLCGSLCDAVLPDGIAAGEGTAGQETLEHLERLNLFVIPLDHERKWYRYHHLFRDLLHQRLVHKLSPEEIARDHLRASAWLEANGDIADAFQHALAAADVGRAARLAESAWQAMDENFQTGTWLRWVNQLPLSVIRVRPVLCTQIGWTYMDAGNVKASESSLRDAEQCLNLPPGEMIVVEKRQFQTLPTRIAFARAYNAQSQHRFSDAVKYAEMAFDLMPDEDDFFHAQVSTLLIGTHWANGNLDNACRLVSDWIEASNQAGKLFFAIAGAFGKADILNAQGRLREVLQTYRQALELAAAHNAEQHTAHHHLGLGMIYHEMGEDERAAQHLQKSFELGRQTTIVDWAYRKSLAQAYLKESEEDLDSAIDLLDEARLFYVRTPTPNLRPVDAMQARIYLKQGKLSKAQEWAHESRLSLQDAPDYLHEFERLTLARVALAEYQYAHNEQLCLDALGLLERQLRLAEQQNRLRSRIEILIMQALAFHAKGKAAKALASLEQALTLAEPEGYLRIFVDEGEAMRMLIAGFRISIEKQISSSAHAQPGYTGKLLAAFTTPVNKQSTIKNPKSEMVEPLSERELEVLRLVAQGLTNQEISQKLFVALSTVKGHNLRIFAKLGAKSRTEAVARARELGLL